MNCLIKKNDALKYNMRTYKQGDFLLSLFDVAEKLGIVETEVGLENKLSLRILSYISRKSVNIRYGDEMYNETYTVLRNVIYIIELYITSSDFVESELSWYNIVKIIDSDKSGITKLINTSEEYLKRSRLKVLEKLDNCKRRISLIPEAYRYLEVIKDLEVAINGYIKYLDSKEFLYDSLVIKTTNLSPMFISTQKGYNGIEAITDSLVNEIEIIELFNKEDINNLVIMYMRQTNQSIFYGNLFELVITNYLFANVYNENQKKLEINVVDTKMLLSEIELGTLVAAEIVRDGIEKLDVTESNAKYIRKIDKVIEYKILNIKKRKTIGEAFIVTI